MAEFIYIKGKVKWFRPRALDMKFPPPKWKAVHYLDDESKDKISKLISEGIKNKLGLDEDGYYINISRPATIESRSGNIPLQPPVILDKDGKILEDPQVGNGSDVTTKLAVRNWTSPQGVKGKSIRWESSRIDNLVPFEKDTDFKPEEAKQVKGLHEQAPSVENLF